MKKFSFKDLTTFKTGGSIRYFCEAENEKEVKECVLFAKKNNLPIFVIGGGSDILVSDTDFNGVVIKYTGANIIFNDKGKTAEIAVEAGLVWNKLVEYSVNLNLQGIECLAGIPGTVGAAPIQNIGAYGQELSETLIGVRAYSIEKEKFVEFKNKDCDFGYRDSIFKKPESWQKFVITQITLKLYKNKKPQVLYDSLKPYLSQNTSLREVMEAVVKVRSKRLEDPKKVPNAGSFFKNPIISKTKKEELEKKFNDIKIYPFKKKFKVFAGYLIEKAGWKGKGLGNVKVSEKHALIITNPKGKGKTEDVLKLAEEIQKDVYKKYKIRLEPEVQYIEFKKIGHEL